MALIAFISSYRYLKTMVSFSLQSLLDLCSVRIAYLMWTRQDLTKKFSIEELFDQLVDLVLADVQKLPLPKQVKSRILQIVKPAGKRLLCLMNFWLSKTQPENSLEMAYR
ncbi:hypothetical protein AVEN_30114-1 [Araneus ventricosus]|uniref:Uncharacterized protein n=1 Tax=Araneus ventricosus TaxID=182803 RepID=A0A4Y2UQ85_ARAVE|nr:hypothetical protein AVEN_30114-1 [Araneus ventricosus]